MVTESVVLPPPQGGGGISQSAQRTLSIPKYSSAFWSWLGIIVSSLILWLFLVWCILEVVVGLV